MNAMTTESNIATLPSQGVSACAVPAASQTTAVDTFDVERIREDFPILKLLVDSKPLVYLDNAASSQMPQQVIDRLAVYHSSEHANIHRGVHYLSETATAAYEAARRSSSS